MEKIIIIGSGGHASAVIDMIEKSKRFSIYGLVDSSIPPHSILPKINKEIDGGIVAIGDNWKRKDMVGKIRSLMPDFRFVSAVHPSAVISGNAVIGDGTVVMGGAVINSNAVIGNQCIINTNSSVGHDCMIGNYVSVASGATLGGTVRVGDGAAISQGVNVIHSLQIGEHTEIGPGSTVLSDIGSFTIAYGTPAKAISITPKGERHS